MAAPLFSILNRDVDQARSVLLDAIRPPLRDLVGFRARDHLASLYRPDPPLSAAAQIAEDAIGAKFAHVNAVRGLAGTSSIAALVSQFSAVQVPSVMPAAGVLEDFRRPPVLVTPTEFFGTTSTARLMAVRALHGLSRRPDLAPRVARAHRRLLDDTNPANAQRLADTARQLGEDPAALGDVLARPDVEDLIRDPEVREKAARLVRASPYTLDHLTPGQAVVLIATAYVLAALVVLTYGGFDTVPLELAWLLTGEGFSQSRQALIDARRKAREATESSGSNEER